MVTSVKPIVGNARAGVTQDVWRHIGAGNPRRDVSNGSGSCRKRCPHTARGRRMFQHRRCAVAPDIRQRASRRDGWIHPPYCPPIASSLRRCQPPSISGLSSLRLLPVMRGDRRGHPAAGISSQSRVRFRSAHPARSRPVHFFPNALKRPPSSFDATPPSAPKPPVAPITPVMIGINVASVEPETGAVVLAV